MRSSEVSQKNSKFCFNMNHQHYFSHEPSWTMVSRFPSANDLPRNPWRKRTRPPRRRKGPWRPVPRFPKWIANISNPTSTRPEPKKKGKTCLKWGIRYTSQFLTVRFELVFFWLMVCNSCLESLKYQVLKH